MPMPSPTSLPPIDPNQRYAISEAAAYLRICRPYVYKLINTKKLRTLRDGRRRYVPGSELIRHSTLPSA